VVTKRDGYAIELGDGNPGRRPDQDVHSGNRYVRPLLANSCGQEAVSAADVQDAGVGRQHFAYMLAKPVYPPVMNEICMRLFPEIHRYFLRFSPSTVAKKLEK